MDKCGIGKLSRMDCGSVTVKDTMIIEYQALSDCQRDIRGHLDMLKLRGEDVLSEKELILLRAGKDIFRGPLFGIISYGVLFAHGLVSYIFGIFDVTAAINFRLCPNHQDSFGIKWRGRKNLCQVPEGVASHRSEKYMGDRAVIKFCSRCNMKVFICNI